MTTRNKDIARNAAISPSKVGTTAVESWGAHATGLTEGMTLGDVETTCTILNLTDFDAGTLSVTGGGLDAEHPDVIRGLEVVLEGGASTDITGGKATVVYLGPNGRRRTKAVNISWTGGAGWTSYRVGDGFTKVVSFDANSAGGDITGANIGLGLSEQLSLRNTLDLDTGAIIHEEGAATLPTDLDSGGLFTPVSSVSAAVAVTVHYGSVR